MADPGEGACPLCGGPPARVTLHKRKLPAETLAVARVGIRDEAAALREEVERQQRGIVELHAELEAERGAAAGAASEAMSMILRLQREKSEALMEARQFRRYAEERFTHDAAEVAALHDAIAQRDATVRSLSAQLRACHSRLLHLGFLSPSSLPSSPTAATEGHHDHPFADDNHWINCIDHPEASDVGTPRTHHLLNRMPSRTADKGVICASPGFSSHVRTISGDSLFLHEDGGVSVADEFPLVVDREASDQEEDSDRVYTVDAVHGVPVVEPDDRCYFGTPIGSEMRYKGRIGAWAEEEEIQKLKARLRALEADRVSMRRAIISMGSEKTQVVLLEEIAQQLCKEAVPLQAVPFKVHSPLRSVVVAQRKVVKRQSFFVKFVIIAVIKWITSVFSWRRRSYRIKYPIGMCGSNVGLMLLLDRFPKRHRRFLNKRS